MNSTEAITVNADIIVIGSGVSGLAAAVTAAEGGAKVVVFEKERSLGGTSNFFDGMFAVESEMQRERYIRYSRDEAFTNIMEYSHWRANPRLVRAIVDESGRTIGWLRSLGVEFVDATINDARCAPHLSRRQGTRGCRDQSAGHCGKGEGRRTQIGSAGQGDTARGRHGLRRSRRGERSEE